MTRATLVLPEWIAAELAAISKNPLETAGVVLAGVARTNTGLRLLGADLYLIPEDGYDIREPDRLGIPSRSYVAALAEAGARGLCAIFLHTHPSDVAEPRPSPWDEIVDDQLADTFRIRTGSDIYASVVLSPSVGWFTFTGRGTDADKTFMIDRVMVVGDRIAVVHDLDSSLPGLDQSMFDRNIRAFGSGIQSALSGLMIGVVGCGGTGSAVAEQLVRLGARSLLLIDPDVIADSNVTRVYGSIPKDIGRPKPDVLASHLVSIAPDGDFRGICGSVLDQTTARALTSCDVIFGCTDDNAGRLVLTRLAAYYLCALIDCGVLISSADEVISAIHGRVTVQTPGAACLVCRNRIDLARAAAEQLSEDERAERQREGYAPELGNAEPAVVTFTTAVAAQAVTELLDRFIGFGPTPISTEILLRIHDHEISGNRLDPKPDHLCHPAAGTLGTGDRDPFIGQLWRAA